MPVTVYTENLAEAVAPGVVRSRLEPGGKDGPDGAVRDSQELGGGCWTELFTLGRSDDEWRYLIPDIRMAANQVWPLHWHDCWTAVVLLDGSLLMGDWEMGPGDVLIAEPGVEYGLLLVGPQGCQLLEVFARDVLSPGGYGEEYRDHPTLQYVKGLEGTNFLARPPACRENASRQVVPIDETPGLAKGHLDGTAYWDLGDRDDARRGAIFDRMLSAGSELAAESVPDWRGFLVLDGSLRVGDRLLVVNDLLLAEPDAQVPVITVGQGGAHLLEFARTAASITR
jgi:hypothetical protein